MALKSRPTSVDVSGLNGLSRRSACSCLAEFFREEFLKHHRCLEQQREYFSDTAITQVEDAISRVMANLDSLCQRDDACQKIGELLRQIDTVTKLSAWTDPHTLH